MPRKVEATAARPHPTLIWRNIPALAATAAAFLLIVGFAIVFETEGLYQKQRVAELTVQARILASTVTAAVTFRDRDAAQEYVDALSADPALRVAAVYTDDGTLFASYAAANPLPVPDHLASGAVPEVPGQLVVTAPIAQNGTVLGTVYVGTLAEPLMMRIQRYSAIVLLAVMASLVVVVLGLAQAALTRVNRELEERAAELADVNERLEQQIAERERVEETLRQAQKMEAVGQLTGGIAHDFNNLLQVILGNLNMLKRRVRQDDAAIAQKLEAAQRAGERAAVLTAQLLAFARRQPLDPRIVNVNQLVLGMTSLLQRTLGETVAIETRLAPDLWPILADTNQLENALLNLAVNARDAMPRGGMLTILTRNAHLEQSGDPVADHVQEGDYVQIAVRDTGTGMTKDIIAKAFEPFFTTKEIGRGTGLGLSQVYGFVRQSGGRVTIESEPGRGTTVEISLPRPKRAEPPVEPILSSPEIPRGFADELILAVEDDPAVRANSVEMLRDLGYRVIEAADGEAALQLLDQIPELRLLFTDVGLPGGINGRQLADRMLRRRPDLKVLFTTGYARDVIVHHGRLDPGIQLLGKPFTLAALATRIRQLLEDEPAPER